MWNNFFKHIDIAPENAHVLDGNAVDLVAECDQYERLIAEAGGVDLFVGGEIYEYCFFVLCSFLTVLPGNDTASFTLAPHTFLVY